MWQSFQEGMQKRQDDAVRQNLPLFRFAYRLFSVVIPLFMVGWTCIGSTIIFQCVRDIISTGTPLVVNEEQTTWAGTAGFVGGLFGMMLFGLLCMWVGLRQFKKGWARHFERIERDT
jgi:hypothetical protein